VQVVCGAPNAGRMKSVFAAWHHNSGQEDHPRQRGDSGRRIERHAVFGAELELSDDHDGILDLPRAPVGAAYAAWAFSMIQSSRSIFCQPAGCAGIDGIARDLAAARLGKLKSAVIEPAAESFRVQSRSGSISWPRTRISPQLCAAPRQRRSQWAKSGVDAKAARGNRAAADQCARRYHQLLTFDRARPLHVFDANKITGNLIVRRAALERSSSRSMADLTGSM